MKENVVGSKSMAFAVRIVNLYKYLTTRRRELVQSENSVRCR